MNLNSGCRPEDSRQACRGRGHPGKGNNLRTRIFFDTEFTGLHKGTTLVSIGCVAQDNRAFYAEFTDYETAQLNPWLDENVIKKLEYNHRPDPWMERDPKLVQIRGDQEFVRKELGGWLKQFGPIEFWADCPAFDWVLFCDLFGGAFKIPSNSYYVPFDIATLLVAKGHKAQVNRESFVGKDNWPEKKSRKHHALWDARITKLVYEKISGEPTRLAVGASESQLSE